MSNEEQAVDTIEMLYERLNSYNKQDLFNYGYLLESYEILYKDIEEKDKEIERLNKIIKDIKSQLDYLETYSSKEDVFEDMKRRLDRIDKIIGSDKE